MITITDAAQTYLQQLLDKQDVQDIAVRLFVHNPGTFTAETCLAYCKPGEEQATDTRIDDLMFTVYLDAPSLPYLKDTAVDFDSDQMGGQLTIKAPNAKLPQVDENSAVADQVRYVLFNDINPGLAAHGGMVQLIEMKENDTIAVLQFGGGCQGCGMIDTTLQHGVETMIKEKVPQIVAIQDITDHSQADNAYFS